jgi:hypothetical protein
MELRWELDTFPDSYGDQNLLSGRDVLGWLLRATTGEMLWVTAYKNGSARKTMVIGHISEDEAKAVVEAMIRLEG